MARYELLTTWCVDAPIERVFAVLNDSAAFPEWWTGVTAVQVLQEGDERGVDELARYSWRSTLPYTLTFDALDERVGATASARLCNHDRVMRQGGLGLAERLGARLIVQG